MEYRSLGTTDIQVSTICLGCWAFAGDKMWGPQDDQNSITTIHAALDAGINFLDTAEAYGDGYSEEIVGKALKDRRNSAVIATKVKPTNLAPADVISSCEDSLRRLQTDYIDLYQIHWANHDIPLDETLATMQDLQQQGKIRGIGVSNFGVQDMRTALQTASIASNQLAYSLLARAIEHEILPECIEQEIGVLCYSPLMHGLLTGKYESADDFPASRARTRHFSSEREGTVHDEPGCEKETFEAIASIRDLSTSIDHSMVETSITWLLHQNGVTSVIAGARNPAQIQQTAQAADVTLSQDTLQQLTAATDPVKAALGTNVDMWRSASRTR